MPGKTLKKPSPIVHTSIQLPRKLWTRFMYHAALNGLDKTGALKEATNLFIKQSEKINGGADL